VLEIAAKKFDQDVERKGEELLVREERVELGKDALQKVRRDGISLVVRHRGHVGERVLDAVECVVVDELEQLGRTLGLGRIDRAVDDVAQENQQNELVLLRQLATVGQERLLQQPCHIIERSLFVYVNQDEDGFQL